MSDRVGCLQRRLRFIKITCEPFRSSKRTNSLPLPACPPSPLPSPFFCWRGNGEHRKLREGLSLFIYLRLDCQSFRNRETRLAKFPHQTPKWPCGTYLLYQNYLTPGSASSASASASAAACGARMGLASGQSVGTC